ncbi:MAG: gamma-glutamyltransferase family protein [Deltaproteobacteria bacterium]|nr:gamma-glutamyltransferase family protein [Deltaproteobacteria bacterium]
MVNDNVPFIFEQARNSMRPVIQGTSCMVVTGHPLATQAAMRILQQGGNAVDAGVAAGICMSVVHSDMVNFAGVAPIMLYEASSGELVTIDGLGRWPRKASVDFFLQHHGGQIPPGILTAVVPAAPDAWIQALKKYGTMTFTDVTRDAIHLAENGFPMHRFMSGHIKSAVEDYRQWQTTAAVFLPNGRPPEPGEVFYQKDLAWTLKQMVRAEQKARFEGREKALKAARDEFYHGSIAKIISDYHQKHGGLLTLEDFADYHVKLEIPPKITFKDYEVYGCGPWSQGPALLQALNLVECFDLKTIGHNSTGYIHFITEALKLVFSDREKYIGDPEFVDVPLKGLLSKDYASRRVREIDPERAMPEMPQAGDPWHYQGLLAGGSASIPNNQAGSSTQAGKYDHVDTSYVAVVDRHGNVFSAVPSDIPTSTPIIPPTGLAVSSRGVQSRVDKNHPSCIEPGKRPRLTPNPCMLFKDDRPCMVVGSPGGDVQCQAVLQVILNLIVFGMDPQEAVEAPRFATFSFPSSFAPHVYRPGLLKVENRVNGSIIQQLKAKGHNVGLWPQWAWKAGGVCTIVFDRMQGVLSAGADPRRESYAMGW